MSKTTFVHATFCDDVREELGGKMSLMGIYGPDIILPSLPLTLPKLVTVITVKRNSLKDIKNIEVSMTMNDEILLNQNFSMPDIQKSSDDAKGIEARIILQAVPFEIKEAGKYEVNVTVDDTPYYAGGLTIKTS